MVHMIKLECRFLLTLIMTMSVLDLSSQRQNTAISLRGPSASTSNGILSAHYFKYSNISRLKVLHNGYTIL